MEWWKNSDSFADRTYPAIRESPFWDRFAEAFDTEEACATRMDLNPHGERQGTPDLDRILQLTYCLFYSGEHPDYRGASIEERLATAQKLSHTVRAMLLFPDDPPSPLIPKLEDLLKQARAGRKWSQPRTGWEGLQALLYFVDREHKLPSKHELNVEAKRNLSCQPRVLPAEQTDSTWTFGSPFRDQEGDFRVLRVDFKPLKMTHTFLVVVPENCWDSVRWAKGDLPRVITPLGLGGLPQRNEVSNDPKSGC